MYSIVEIHSCDSGRAMFAVSNQGPCTHATLLPSGQCSVGGHTWERAIMPPASL